MNQDNYICAGQYLDNYAPSLEYPIAGIVNSTTPALFGVFDGMGGEEYGEIASFIAAKCASETTFGDDPLEDLRAFCSTTNKAICEYTKEHDILSMGTTAALLVFTKKLIALCNIGDSKIFRFAKNQLEQISTDHYSVVAFGVKPPLSQNLGIPSEEMIIDPYFAKGIYNDGDIFLLCSDGLSDMMTTDEMATIMKTEDFSGLAEKLLNEALEKGGKDNITIILCKVERIRWNLFKLSKAI